MNDPIPQDPAPWARKILDLKGAVPFRAVTITMVSDHKVAVARAEDVEVADTCAEVWGADGSWRFHALEWVLDIAVGVEAGAAPRPPRYAARLRALQADGPSGLLVITTRDGERYALAGPHEYLVSRDGRSVAAGERGGGLAVLDAAEIVDLAPA